MSIDPIGVAYGRDDATVATSGPRIAAEPSNELAGIAAAIERVEALLAACGPGPQSADAVERIADIAFVLHERDVEASLCDALDVAVRELGNANAASQANVQHVRQAAELLRELSHRVADMIALLQVSPPAAANDAVTNEAIPVEGEPAAAQQPASEDLDGEIPREGLFGAEVLEDDEFARAVAELAASLPALAEPVDALVITLREPNEFAPNETAIAPETDSETAFAPESGEAIHGAPRELADLAPAESELADEPEEAIAEALHEPADLAVEKYALASEPEAVAETSDESADLAAEKAALAPGQQASAGDDTPPVIERTQAEESSTPEVAGEQLLHEDTLAALAAPETLAGEAMTEAIANATLLSEGTLAETLSGEARLETGDAAVPPDAPVASSENALAEACAPVATPEPETALAPDESPVGVPEPAEQEQQLGDATSEVAEIAASTPAEPPSNEAAVRAGADADDGPVQIAGEPNAPDADDEGAHAAVEADEEPPPRVSESSQSLLPELALVDPQDDPGDLFEPIAGAAPPIATAIVEELKAASKVSAPAATMQPHSAGAASDPLASMRTLNAEELLALFT